jgi:hypothetical protein
MSEAAWRSFNPELLAVIDRFIREDQPQMTREQALAYIVYDWGVGMGYIYGPSEQPH